MSLGQSFRARAVGIGVWMPNFRASYEAEAMMPRLSPPTAMGLPRNRVSAACSTDAKKASASRWTIVRMPSSRPLSRLLTREEGIRIEMDNRARHGHSSNQRFQGVRKDRCDKLANLGFL